MGEDTIALVRIPKLSVPKASRFTVVRCRDCSLVFIGDDFRSCSANEHAMRLRDALGNRLDVHDDDRGICFFPDVDGPPSGETYDAIVREVGRAGKWGSASTTVSKRTVFADRVLREAASDRGLEREWFAARLAKGARRKQRAELDALVDVVMDTIYLERDDPTEADVLRAIIDSRVAAWVAGEPPLFKAPTRARKTVPTTKPGEPGYDPDAAEMVLLFGGDEASWKAALAPSTRRR